MSYTLPPLIELHHEKYTKKQIKKNTTAKNLDLYKQILILQKIALDKKLELVESVMGKPWGDVVEVAMSQYDAISEELDEYLIKQDY